MSLLSELLSAIWATVAINQLTETKVKKVEAVWDLLEGEYSLPWSAVNSHFVMGTFGFAFCIGCRIYYHAGRGMLGTGLASISMAGLLFMTSIVNRAIAAGGGDGVHGYGGSVIALFLKYGSLLVRRATSESKFGVLELGSFLAVLAGIVL